jgi:glycosyltransferase involved in cell wall biosynthesis
MRIFVYGGAYSYWGDFNPSDIDDPDCQRMIGGGETALINTSRELAALGHDVVAFYNIGKPGSYDGVDYLPVNLWDALSHSMVHDVAVSWDQPFALRQNIKATIRGCAFQLNHVHIATIDELIDFYFSPSHWHANRFSTELAPESTQEHWHGRMTNGVDMRRYRKNGRGRDPYRVIHSSSPDRGLHHLLAIWKDVKGQVPEANLHLYYDYERWFAATDEAMKTYGLPIPTGDRAYLVRDYLNELLGDEWGVYHHGGIGQWQLAQEQMQAGILAYPCDPIHPTEGFSMTCLEALAAGCELVTTDADALDELWAPSATILPLPVISDGWADVLVQKLRNPPTEPERESFRNYARKFTWKKLGKRWERFFENCLGESS